MRRAKYQVSADEDGSWSVVDADSEMPAVLNDVPQVGLTEEDARDLVKTLNAVADDG